MKTANELQITMTEYDALKKTRELLDSGQVVWQDRENEQVLDWGHEPMQFNMSTIRSDEGCQTVCCIGGWMAHTMGKTDRWEAIDYVNNKISPALASLCFPEPGLMNAIKPEHAVKAIDNFFNTGFPMWYHVLKGSAAFEEIEEARHRHMSESHSAGSSHRISDTPSPRVVAERQIVNLGRYLDSTEHDAIDRASEPLLIDHKG